MIDRRVWCVCWLGAAVACAHGDHHDCSRLDGGACTANDAGAPSRDGSVAPAHDAAVTTDSGHAADAGDVRMDAASAADSGKPSRDAGSHDDNAGSAAADGGKHDEDDAGVIERDGTYTCMPLQNYAYDCVEPWLDSVYQRPDGGGSAWPLQLDDGHLTLDGYGFDQAQISCTGSWTGDEFTCAAQWSRAGRVCDNALHLRAQPDGSLIFSVAMRLEELASCHK